MDATYDEVLISLGMEPSCRLTSERPKCGTYSGYNTHTSRGEDPCDDCRDANNAYKRKRYAAPKYGRLLPPIKHGSRWGADRHRYRQEPVCDKCRAAANAYNSDRQRQWRRQPLQSAGGGR